MHGHRTRAAMAFPALWAALLLAGCGGTGTAGSESAATDANGTTHATTPVEPPPITPAERRWLKAVRHYDRRLVGTMSGTTVMTSDSLARERDFDDSCKGALRRAGSPGRYQPVQPMVHRACAMLHQAALQLRHALASGMISGSIIEGADFADFDRATNAALNKEGAATNVLAHALVKADRITKRFGPAT
jgi:hypothetical protein